MLILSWRQLEHVVGEYTRYYNGRRPHRGLGQRAPARGPAPPLDPQRLHEIERRDRLGGLLHEYRVAA
jgi:putative transposase